MGTAHVRPVQLAMCTPIIRTAFVQQRYSNTGGWLRGVWLWQCTSGTFRRTGKPGRGWARRRAGTGSSTSTLLTSWRQTPSTCSMMPWKFCLKVRTPCHPVPGPLIKSNCPTHCDGLSPINRLVSTRRDLVLCWELVCSILVQGHHFLGRSVLCLSEHAFVPVSAFYKHDACLMKTCMC